MNRDELRALQQPLKEQYKTDPNAAMITLRATGALGDDVTCSVETGRALVEAGLHPATGGTGFAACSGDMLLQALVACAGVTLSAVATSICLELRGATISAEGDPISVDSSASRRARRWDFSGSDCPSSSTPMRPRPRRRS